MAPHHFLFLALALLATASLSPRASADSGTAILANAPYTPTECNGNTDMGTMVASVRDDIWEGGSACGVRYQVQCTAAANQGSQPCNGGGAVEVTVTNHCRHCNATMMLSREAFTSIAKPSAGIVTISYQKSN